MNNHALETSRTDQESQKREGATNQRKDGRTESHYKEKKEVEKENCSHSHKTLLTRRLVSAALQQWIRARQYKGKVVHTFSGCKQCKENLEMVAG